MVAHHRGSTVIDWKGDTEVPTVVCCAEEVVQSTKEIMLVEVFDSTSYGKSTPCLFQFGNLRVSGFQDIRLNAGTGGAKAMVPFLKLRWII